MKKLSLGLALCVAAMAALATSAPAPVTFAVMEFEVQGNTVLPANVVEQTLAPFLGPGRSIQDLESAREALEKAYQDAGFLSVVVTLPNQRIKADGVVRFEITAAKVDRLTVTGAAYHKPSRIKAQVPSVAPGVVPYFPAVQDELGAIQSADMQITPLISGGAQPEQLNIELKVQDKPAISGMLELSNRQSFNTSTGRLLGVASYGNLFQLGHRVGLSWQYAPWRPADANTLTWIYGMPLGRRDDLSLAYTRSDSDTPIVSGDGGNTITRGAFFSARWTHDLEARHLPIRHGTFVAVDYKSNEDQTNLNFSASSTKPPLKYATVSAGYNLTWMPSDEKTLSANVGVVTSNAALAGRRVLCDGERLEQFACKRFGARPDFLAWQGGGSYTGPLWAGWRVLSKFDAQLASGPLVSGEQYSLGGSETVRGYYDYEQSGDTGAQFKLELISPSASFADDWRASGLAFFDRGWVVVHQALSGQVAQAHLASVGLGARVDSGSGLQLSIDLAKPLKQTRRAEEGGFRPTTEKDWRFHVSARQTF